MCVGVIQVSALWCTCRGPFNQALRGYRLTNLDLYPFLQVMPYLGRRATENKSVLGEGAAMKEKERARREIWKQVTFGRGS